MEGINYNHLYYFWTVARLGSVSKAAAELHLSQPTISEQLKKLEHSLGGTLFERAGRGLRLSETGNQVYTYADKIFHLAGEMESAIAHGSPAPHHLKVGFERGLSSFFVHSRLSRALQLGKIRVTVLQDPLESLLPRLAARELDLILADRRGADFTGFRLYHHEIARSGVTFLAAKGLLHGSFPKSLDGAPFLMPEPKDALHGNLHSWFAKCRVQPRVVAEVSDPSLLCLLGEQRVGVLAVATHVEADIKARFKLEMAGRTKAVTQEVFAITGERRITTPAVLAMLRPAKSRR